jgi:dTDP-4-dehydrorhamnose 3,5-epimerase
MSAMHMQVIPTKIADVWLLKPPIWPDERGFFLESFHSQRFAQCIGLDVVFVQDNHSRSHQHVLRGLHYQRHPHAQGKLVRVVQGAVFDVVVDLRPRSSTYGHWMGEILSADNHHQLWIPPGFAHGFLTLSATADVLYKTTAEYAPAHEGVLRWDDPQLGIAWPLTGPPSLSSKDAAGLCWAQMEQENQKDVR